jgi:hypothetical protein
MTTSDNIAAIEKALESVDLVEWFAGGVTDDGLTIVDDGRSHGIFPIMAETHEAKFIAACNPAAISTLLAEARKAEAMVLALKTPFCVLYLDGRNEHGTHVLPSFPSSIAVVDGDLAEQAEAIMSAAEAEGLTEGDHVWAEFSNVPPQIGDEGRVELDGYWDFRRINKAMSTLLQGEKP